jgi:cytochrome c553
MPEHDDRLLVTERGVSNAFIATGVGMVAVLVLFLVLATSQPQGVYQTADDSQYRATVTAAAEDLEGFELVGDTGARIDIDRAMELVLERGVGLSMTSLLPGATPPMATAPAEPAEPAEPADAAADGGADDAADAARAEAAPEGDVVARFAAATDANGETVYANCTSCHQATGAGIPGAFPPLNGGHAAELARVEGGRAYLVNAMLYGVQGALNVGGTTYNGVMPAWPQLNDDQIAAVLNYTVTAWDNADALPEGYAPFTPDEVAAARDQGLSGADVLAARPDPTGPIAPTGDGDGAAAPADSAPAEPAPAEPAPAEVDAAAPPADSGDLAERLAAATETTGDAAYANCTSCHQATGAGIPGAFPPLNGGHAAELATADGGRTYLVNAMLYGVQGSMQVQGTTYNGVMPGWQQLSDDVLAAALNHVVATWDNLEALPADFEPFTPDEIAAGRGQGLAASQVLEARPTLP